MLRRLTILLATLALAGCALHPRQPYISDLVREAQAAAEKMTRADIAHYESTLAKLEAWKATATEDQKDAAAVSYVQGINPGVVYGGALSPEDCAWLVSYSRWVDAGTCEPGGRRCTFGLKNLVGPPPPETACSQPECAGKDAITYQDWQFQVWRVTSIWREKAGLCRLAAAGWWNYGAGGVPAPTAAEIEQDAISREFERQEQEHPHG
jgi:hypothetical protein